jgi:hypothetical protein
VIARIDSKKRIPIASVMDELKLSVGDHVDLSTDSTGSAIIVLPIPPRCGICGKQTSMLAEYGTDPVRSVCTACAEELCSATLVFQPGN